MVRMKSSAYHGFVTKKKKTPRPADQSAFSFGFKSLLVFVPLRFHALVVFMLRHFFAAFFLDGTHLGFSFF
jgi:hypothetical protein